MRKLMWLTVGFAVAVAAGVYFVPANWLVLLCGLCAVAAIPLLFWNNAVSRRVCVCLLGVALGFLRLWLLNTQVLEVVRPLDDMVLNLRVEVADYPEETDRGYRMDAVLLLDNRRWKLRLYGVEPLELTPGDQMQLTAQLHFNEDSYLGGEGIFLTGTVQEILQIDRAQKLPARYIPRWLSRELRQILGKTFPADTAGFAKALLLGYTEDLTYAQDTALKVSGIRHVVAVSGLHVSILFSVAYLLAQKRKLLTALFGLPLLFVFAAVAGFTPSVLRACVMQALMILALLFDREYDPPTALAAACLVMLGCNPLIIGKASFQMSVGCVAGILLFSSRISGYLRSRICPKKAPATSRRYRLCSWVAQSMGVTLSAMVFVTPLSALYFETVSLIGVVTNLLCLWVVSFAFCGTMLVCVFGAIWLPAARALAAVIAWLMRYVLWVAKLLSQIPVAAVYLCDGYITAWLMFCYVLLVVFWISRKKRPMQLLLCMALSLAVCLGASRLERKLETFRFTALNVGQGQCILLQSEEETYMVDCGGDYDRDAADLAAAQLLSMGVTRLDGLILTHYDKDHAGGANMLLSRIPADRLYLPDIADPTGTRDALVSDWAEGIVWVRENQTIPIPLGEIRLYGGENEKTDNESSLCVLFQTEKCAILITGDRPAKAEAVLLENGLPDKVDILVVGHHGAADATSLALLREVRPQVAVISVGMNHFGHPDEQTLARLALFGCYVLRTDLDGTIIFRG